MTTKLKAFGITLLIMGLMGLFIWSAKHYPNVIAWILSGGVLFVVGGFIYMMVYEVISGDDSHHGTR